MDLRISPRGRFEIDRQVGGYSVVTSLSENLSQYLRAAITDQLKSNTFPSIRAADIARADKLAEYKIDAQRRIIQLVLNSPFSSDFNQESIQVDVARSQRDSISITIRYFGGNADEVLVNYSVDGGRLVLDEELDIPYVSDGEERLIEEEVVIVDQSVELDVSCEPTGVLYICDEGVSPSTEQTTINFKDIPDIERRIAKNVTIDGILFSTLGSRTSPLVHIGGDSIDNPEIYQGLFDSIFLSTLIKNRGTNFKITGVLPVTGDIRLIRYIPSVEDWLIEVSSENQSSVVVEIASIEAIDTSDRRFYTDAKSSTPVDHYPFPNEAVRGRKYYALDNVLNPGRYTCYYKGLVKPRYNGSIEEV